MSAQPQVSSNPRVMICDSEYISLFTLDAALKQAGIDATLVESQEVASWIFGRQGNSFSAIIIEAHIPMGKTPLEGRTHELVRHFRASGYKGKIIGFCCADTTGMIEAGCDFVCDGVNLLAEMILFALELGPDPRLVPA